MKSVIVAGQRSYLEADVDPDEVRAAREADAAFVRGTGGAGYGRRDSGCRAQDRDPRAEGADGNRWGTPSQVLYGFSSQRIWNTRG